MVQIGDYTCDWIDDQELGQLLGNARPKTLQDIENDPYWGTIFRKWVTWLDGNGYSGVKAIYDRWEADPKGDARDELKTAGNGDLRNQFYEAVGEVKAHARAWDRESGAAEKRIDDALGI